MSDLISREEALACFEALKNYSGLTIREQLRKLMPVEQTEWISVKKHGKPKKSGRYWVTIQSTTSSVKWVRADEYHAERDFFDTEMEWSNSGIKITAWQPIIDPSPYKEKDACANGVTQYLKRRTTIKSHAELFITKIKRKGGLVSVRP